MKTLPDCPRCDAARTLFPVRGEGRGVVVCECSCCSAVRVNADGEVVHHDRQTDVSGHAIYDDQ